MTLLLARCKYCHSSGDHAEVPPCPALFTPPTLEEVRGLAHHYASRGRPEESGSLLARVIYTALHHMEGSCLLRPVQPCEGCGEPLTGRPFVSDVMPDHVSFLFGPCNICALRRTT